MSYVHTNVEIGGHVAMLTDFSENSASIKDVQQSYITGDNCSFTVFVHLMGKQVPVKLRGEVVQAHDHIIDVMFEAPTRNWNRMLRALKECAFKA